MGQTCTECICKIEDCPCCADGDHRAERPIAVVGLLEAEKILRRFTPVAFTEYQSGRADILKGAFRDVANDVLNFTQGGREQALALTYLEQASMMAVQAIAREGDK